jgi:hypothetical protein
MALSNQGDLTTFFLSPTSHLKGVSKSCELALAIDTKVPLCFILPFPSPTIPEDDLPLMAKSQTKLAGIRKAPVSHLP